MRVALLSSAYPYGTGETFLDTELHGLLDKHEVVVWPVSHRAQGAKRETAARTYSLSLLSPHTLRLALRAVTRRPAAAIKVTSAILFDDSPLRVKAKNLAVLPKAFALAEAARAMNVDHLHAYWLSTPATVAYVVGTLTGIPWSASAHRWDIYENNMVPRKLRSAQFVRAISERGQRDLGLREPKAQNRIPLVRVGIEMPGVPAPTPPASPHEELRILCAANLVAVKGHRYLIEGVAQAKRRGVAVTLTLAGDGPLREPLRRLTAVLGIANEVEFRGRVRHDTLLRELSEGRYDVAALTSIEEPGGLMEGVPVALMEAMARGIPCLATDSGSIPELLSDGCGVVVPHSNSAAIAEAIVQLASDPAERAHIGACARSRIAAEFDRDRTTAALARLIAGQVDGEKPAVMGNRNESIASRER